MEEEHESTPKRIQDEDRLAQLGYKQELKRDWSMMHNFGVSFSIIVSWPILFLLIISNTANNNSIYSSISCKTSCIARDYVIDLFSHSLSNAS